MQRMGSGDTFGGRLTTAMTDARVSPIELSAAAGGAFSPRTIFRWRAGHTAPGVEAIPMLCEQLDVTADWLLGCTTMVQLQSDAMQVTTKGRGITERGTV